MLTYQGIVMLGLVLISGGWLQDSDRGEPPGPLSRFHRELSGPDGCKSCHSLDGEVDHKRCLACHTEMSRRIRDARGFHQDKDEFCFACHAEHQGVDSELIELNPDSFDHEETGFPLLGFHARVGDCRRCHSPSNAISRRPSRTFLLADSRCSTCHTDPHNASFSEDCTSCHNSEVSFGEARFDHGSTRFPLTGAHNELGCNNCHRLLPASLRDVKIETSDRCGLCHQSAHSDRMSLCTHCHTTEEWRVRAW